MWFCRWWEFFSFSSDFDGLFPNHSLWKMQTKITLVFRKMRDKMITYIDILWCVQHNTVSNTLCSAKYCVHTYPKDLLFAFHISTCCGRIMLCLRSTSLSFIRDIYNRYTSLVSCEIPISNIHKIYEILIQHLAFIG